MTIISCLGSGEQREVAQSRNNVLQYVYFTDGIVSKLRTQTRLKKSREGVGSFSENLLKSLQQKIILCNPKKNNIMQPVPSAEKRGKPNRGCFGFTPNWLKSGKNTCSDWLLKQVAKHTIATQALRTKRANAPRTAGLLNMSRSGMP